MSEALIERARAAFAYPPAIARAYTDQVVFPVATMVDRGPDFERFPGWEGSEVLLLSHEKQGVVSWGMELGLDRRGQVVVGGDLPGGVGTEVYAESVESFVACRLWDLSLLETEPLIQAQALPVQDADLNAIRSAWIEGTRTFAWPGWTNYRFERGAVRLTIWAGDGQADWWISGPRADVAAELPGLRKLSNLDEALWSNDEAGATLLD